ncbi:MAG: aminoacyl-tRNA hydrolase [Oscillospiraceae bacterium]|nr:aminoacyl-tRNA hydrolase [Oscillospiraceae bacterium]
MGFFNKFKQGNKGGKKTRDSINAVQNPPEYIICGLGNPGSNYENTRHNCGFMALDLLAEQEKFQFKKLKFKSLTALEVINGVKCLLMKPTTFMNLSGEALVPAMKFYKIPPEKVIVLFDDFSIPFGNLKIRRSGSDGGHNGMKNIILQAGVDTFPRIKIGIGSPPHKDFPVKDWVLSPFKKSEGKGLEDSLARAVGALRVMIKGDIDKAMNEFNGNG